MKRQEGDKRLNDLIEAITAIASLDFSKKLEVKGKEDLIDVVSLGFNMLSEALEDTVVSKQQLEESKQKYEMLFSKANDIILLIKDGQISDFNDKALTVFGYMASELMGLPIIQLMPELQKDGSCSANLITEVTRETLKKGSSLKTIQTIRKDKSIFESEINVGFLKLNDEVYFQTIIRDVSEQVKTEEELKKSVAQFKALFDFAPTAMLIVKGGKPIQINRAFEHMFGYQQKELSTLNIAALTHPEDRQLHKGLEAQLKQNIIPKFSLEKRYIKKNGAILHGIVNVTRIRGVENREDYYITQIVDISEQKKAEQKVQAHVKEVEKINKELDQFAYVVSHDLKAPLRGINALASFIEEDIADGEYEEVRENMSLLRSRIDRMGNLITGILDFSRAGRKKEALELINFGDLLHETIELIAPSPKVQLNSPEKMPTVYTIKISLQQIIQNLLSNAIKYNDKDSIKICIDFQENKQDYIFSIKDNGPGISSQYHHKIFEIFQTLQPRDRVESTGVGLAIVRKNVENLGGKVWVESIEGQGATFFFSLPNNHQLMNPLTISNKIKP